MSTATDITDETRQRLEDSFERSYPNEGEDDAPWIEDSYPRTVSIAESQLLTAEEARAAEEQMLGKRGMPHDDKCSAKLFTGGMCSCAAGQDLTDSVRIRSDAELNDDVPDFLHNAAKAGPPKPALDALGRTPAERKERKIKDAIALGEARAPAIIAHPEKAKRVLTVMKDHELEYPDLYMAVYVAGDWAVPDDEAKFARLFARAGCYRAETVDEADLIVFGGGSDVEPLLYNEPNEERHSSVFYSPARDAADMKLYLQARDQGIPMLGVCRGAQFLHAMNGGKLIQDLDGHYGSHKAWDMRGKQMLEQVSSVHHQACVYNPDGMEVLLSTAGVSTVRWLGQGVKDVKPKIDIEAFYYRDTGCLGVQGHPEYANCNKFSVWCLKQVDNFFLKSQDFIWDGPRVRMTAEAKDAKAIAEQYIENAYSQSKEA